MRKLLLILLLISNGVSSQKQNAALFVSNDHQSNEGIQLKWVYNTLYHPEGFVIQRKEEGGNWQQITASPIKVKKTLQASNKLNKEEQDLHNAVVKVSFDEFKVSIVRAFVIISAIYNNELADYVGIYYHDKSAQKGKTYEYKLTLKSGEELAVSRKITCENYKKIDAPKDLKVFRTKKSVAINWKPDLNSYYAVHIYRKNTKESEFINLTKTGPIALQPKEVKSYTENSTFFIDTAIVYDDSYIYKIIAIDYFGLESEFSAEVQAPSQDFIPPQAPFNLKLAPSSSKSLIEINWDFVDEKDLDGFNIYFSNKAEGPYTKVNSEKITKTTTSFIHKDLEPGGYFYSVSSVDYAGNEMLSNLTTTEIKDRTPPKTPENFKTEALSGEIKMTWNANYETDLKGYYIEKSLSDSNNLDNSYVIVNAQPLKDNFYTEKLSKNIKNEFVYRVVAVDTNYNRSKPSINSLAQMPDVISPNAPIIKNVMYTTESIIIEWLSNAEVDLAGYDLYKSEKGDTNAATKVNFNLIPASINKYTDRQFEKGNQYIYYIIAKDNSQNESKPSPTFSITVPKGKLESQIIVSKALYNIKKQQITLQWDLDKSVEMKGYVVYQKDALGNMKPISALSTFTEFVTKDINSSILEFEIRGYTLDGTIIKTERIIINT